MAKLIGNLPTKKVWVRKEYLTDFHCEFHWHSIQLKYKGKRHFVAFTEVDMVKLNQPREVEEQGAEAHEE